MAARPEQFHERSKLTVKRQESSEQASTSGDSKPRATGGSVATRYTIAVASLVAMSMCVFWLISNYNNQNLLRRQADSLGQSLANQTAVLVTEPVLANDLISTRVIMEQLARQTAIAEAAVINVNGEVVAIASNALEPPLSLFPVPMDYGRYEAPIELENARAGTVRLVLDLSTIEAGTGNNLVFILVATFAIMVIAILLSINYFQYLVSFPLRLLNYAVQDIRYGEVKTCPDPETNNEIGRLIRQFNATAEFLANYTFLNTDELASPQTLEQRQREHRAERVSGAVLCIRLDNFHYLASTCDRKLLVKLLNRVYFMSENIGRLYNGTASYCADGEVVIEFHNSRLEEEQCFYAICAGQLFLRLIASINRIDQARQVEAKFHLAVHHGEFESGLYSPVTGAFDNVHGITLDTVRRLCSECPDNSLLVSETAYHLAGGESRIVGEEYGELDEPQALLTILCSNALASYRQLLDQQAGKLKSLLAASSEG
ncbi:MAG: hypothetical protein R3F41_09785 [Gammaproteobacteria bacterium]|nr:hypothetical protein [Pseudomonadales bacterium]MCP5347894.1 hypothetical protein [Pseudomonadales bacterium]